MAQLIDCGVKGACQAREVCQPITALSIDLVGEDGLFYAYIARIFLLSEGLAEARESSRFEQSGGSNSLAYNRLLLTIMDCYIVPSRYRLVGYWLLSTSLQAVETNRKEQETKENKKRNKDLQLRFNQIASIDLELVVSRGFVELGLQVAGCKVAGSLRAVNGNRRGSVSGGSLEAVGLIGESLSG